MKRVLARLIVSRIGGAAGSFFPGAGTVAGAVGYGAASAIGAGAATGAGVY